MAVTKAIHGQSERGAGAPSEFVRVAAQGKFLFAGDDKFYVRGVTYGPFRPEEHTGDAFDPRVVERDFGEMAANGINAVRVYDVPPRWLLDTAARHGLRIMVGLAWEQHVAFLDDRRRARAIERRVREGVRTCAGHPAVLCYAVGNEIPAAIVRWHGRRRIERFIRRLYRAAKAEDPGAVVTYVNYPSTEYLRLAFLDVVCFNVYLESPERFESYLARLQNVADDRPLLLAEVGLDSRRNGEEGQARAIEWQLRDCFTGGCAGAFVFAWTDEWHRGGLDIDDWDFGLTARDRRPKAALAAARAVFADVPFGERAWPPASVVVCTHNGAATLGDCLEGAHQLDYPDFEVIVVSDGSTDASATVAAASGARLIETDHRGLSSARNTGLAAARGEIVAYVDDDARPDRDWLRYLAHSFMTSDHAAIGGPNIPFRADGHLAQCVAEAPGGPTHVLLSDTEAEHIPGCNMAFRRDRLVAIDGFDARFRVAGDDVDVCWRLHERGWTIGFSPAAFVWHHRRTSLRAYVRQQRGYGEAEALLERKWPARHSAAGHLAWSGRLYGVGAAADHGIRRWRVYYGTWGSSLFQSLYRPARGLLASLTLMPEWYLAVAALMALCALAALWWPLLAAGALVALAVSPLVVDAGLGAARARFRDAPRGRREILFLRLVTAALYLVQPLSRLRGRLRRGLTPWRQPGVGGLSLPRPRTATLWDEQWSQPETRLESIERRLSARGAVTRRGGDFDRWDLEIRGGALGAARLRMATEEHGGGRQLFRLRSWPRIAPPAIALVLLAVALAAAAALSGAWAASALLGGVAGVLGGRAMCECGAAAAHAARALEPLAAPIRRPLRAPGQVVRVLVDVTRGRMLVGTLVVGACASLAIATATRDGVDHRLVPRHTAHHAVGAHPRYAAVFPIGGGRKRHRDRHPRRTDPNEVRNHVRKLAKSAVAGVESNLQSEAP